MRITRLGSSLIGSRIAVIVLDRFRISPRSDRFGSRTRIASLCTFACGSAGCASGCARSPRAPRSLTRSLSRITGSLVCVAFVPHARFAWICGSSDGLHFRLTFCVHSLVCVCIPGSRWMFSYSFLRFSHLHTPRFCTSGSRWFSLLPLVPGSLFHTLDAVASLDGWISFLFSHIVVWFSFSGSFAHALHSLVCSRTRCVWISLLVLFMVCLGSFVLHSLLSLVRLRSSYSSLCVDRLHFAFWIIFCTRSFALFRSFGLRSSRTHTGSHVRTDHTGSLPLRTRTHAQLRQSHWFARARLFSFAFVAHTRILVLTFLDLYHVSRCTAFTSFTSHHVLSDRSLDRLSSDLTFTHKFIAPHARSLDPFPLDHGYGSHCAPLCLTHVRGLHVYSRYVGSRSRTFGLRISLDPHRTRPHTTARIHVLVTLTLCTFLSWFLFLVRFHSFFSVLRFLGSFRLDGSLSRICTRTQFALARTSFVLYLDRTPVLVTFLRFALSAHLDHSHAPFLHALDLVSDLRLSAFTRTRMHSDHFHAHSSLHMVLLVCALDRLGSRAPLLLAFSRMVSRITLFRIADGSFAPHVLHSRLSHVAPLSAWIGSRFITHGSFALARFAAFCYLATSRLRTSLHTSRSHCTHTHTLWITGPGSHRLLVLAARFAPGSRAHLCSRLTLPGLRLRAFCILRFLVMVTRFHLDHMDSSLFHLLVLDGSFRSFCVLLHSSRMRSFITDHRGSFIIARLIGWFGSRGSFSLSFCTLCALTTHLARVRISASSTLWIVTLVFIFHSHSLFVFFSSRSGSFMDLLSHSFAGSLDRWIVFSFSSSLLVFSFADHSLPHKRIVQSGFSFRISFSLSLSSSRFPLDSSHWMVYSFTFSRLFGLRFRDSPLMDHSRVCVAHCAHGSLDHSLSARVLASHLFIVLVYWISLTSRCTLVRLWIARWMRFLDRSRLHFRFHVTRGSVRFHVSLRLHSLTLVRSSVLRGSFSLPTHVLFSRFCGSWFCTLHVSLDGCALASGCGSHSHKHNIYG